MAEIKKTDRKVEQIKNTISANSTTSVQKNPSPDYRATGFLIDGKGYLVTNAHVVNRIKKGLLLENNIP